MEVDNGIDINIDMRLNFVKADQDADQDADQVADKVADKDHSYYSSILMSENECQKVIYYIRDNLKFLFDNDIKSMLDEYEFNMDLFKRKLIKLLSESDNVTCKLLYTLLREDPVNPDENNNNEKFIKALLTHALYDLVHDHHTAGRTSKHHVKCFNYNGSPPHPIVKFKSNQDAIPLSDAANEDSESKVHSANPQYEEHTDKRNKTHKCIKGILPPLFDVFDTGVVGCARKLMEQVRTLKVFASLCDPQGQGPDVGEHPDFDILFEIVLYNMSLLLTTSLFRTLNVHGIFLCASLPKNKSEPGKKREDWLKDPSNYVLRVMRYRKANSKLYVSDDINILVGGGGKCPFSVPGIAKDLSNTLPVYLKKSFIFEWNKMSKIWCSLLDEPEQKISLLDFIEKLEKKQLYIEIISILRDLYYANKMHGDSGQLTLALFLSELSEYFKYNEKSKIYEFVKNIMYRNTVSARSKDTWAGGIMTVLKGPITIGTDDAKFQYTTTDPYAKFDGIDKFESWPLVSSNGALLLLDGDASKKKDEEDEIKKKKEEHDELQKKNMLFQEQQTKVAEQEVQLKLLQETQQKKEGELKDKITQLEEAKRKQEEEARRKQEEEATRKQEEEAKRKQEEEAKRKQEEEANVQITKLNEKLAASHTLNEKQKEQINDLRSIIQKALTKLYSELKILDNSDDLLEVSNAPFTEHRKKYKQDLNTKQKKLLKKFDDLSSETFDEDISYIKNLTNEINTIIEDHHASRKDAGPAAAAKPKRLKPSPKSEEAAAPASAAEEGEGGAPEGEEGASGKLKNNGLEGGGKNFTYEYLSDSSYESDISENSHENIFYNYLIKKELKGGLSFVDGESSYYKATRDEIRSTLKSKKVHDKSIEELLDLSKFAQANLKTASFDEYISINEIVKRAEQLAKYDKDCLLHIKSNNMVLKELEKRENDMKRIYDTYIRLKSNKTFSMFKEREEAIKKLEEPHKTDNGIVFSEISKEHFEMDKNNTDYEPRDIFTGYQKEESEPEKIKKKIEKKLEELEKDELIMITYGEKTVQVQVPNDATSEGSNSYVDKFRKVTTAQLPTIKYNKEWNILIELLKEQMQTNIPVSLVVDSNFAFLSSLKENITHALVNLIHSAASNVSLAQLEPIYNSVLIFMQHVSPIIHKTGKSSESKKYYYELSLCLDKKFIKFMVEDVEDDENSMTDEAPAPAPSSSAAPSEEQIASNEDIFNPFKKFNAKINIKTFFEKTKIQHLNKLFGLITTTTAFFMIYSLNIIRLLYSNIEHDFINIVDPDKAKERKDYEIMIINAKELLSSYLHNTIDVSSGDGYGNFNTLEGLKSTLIGLEDESTAFKILYYKILQKNSFSELADSQPKHNKTLRLFSTKISSIIKKASQLKKFLEDGLIKVEELIKSYNEYNSPLHFKFEKHDDEDAFLSYINNTKKKLENIKVEILIEIKLLINLLNKLKEKSYELVYGLLTTEPNSGASFDKCLDELYELNHLINMTDNSLVLEAPDNSEAFLKDAIKSKNKLACKVYDILLHRKSKQPIAELDYVEYDLEPFKYSDTVSNFISQYHRNNGEYSEKSVKLYYGSLYNTDKIIKEWHIKNLSLYIELRNEVIKTRLYDITMLETIFDAAFNVFNEKAAAKEALNKASLDLINAIKEGLITNYIKTRSRYNKAFVDISYQTFLEIKKIALKLEKKLNSIQDNLDEKTKNKLTDMTKTKRYIERHIIDDDDNMEVVVAAEEATEAAAEEAATEAAKKEADELIKKLESYLSKDKEKMETEEAAEKMEAEEEAAEKMEAEEEAAEKTAAETAEAAEKAAEEAKKKEEEALIKNIEYFLYIINVELKILNPLKQLDIFKEACKFYNKGFTKKEENELNTVAAAAAAAADVTKKGKPPKLILKNKKLQEKKKKMDAAKKKIERFKKFEIFKDNTVEYPNKNDSFIIFMKEKMEYLNILFEILCNNKNISSLIKSLKKDNDKTDLEIYLDFDSENILAEDSDTFVDKSDNTSKSDDHVDVD